MNIKELVIEFTKAHKKEIAIAVSATVVGYILGVAKHKRCISKKYGDLIYAADQLDETTGGSSNQTLIRFLNKTNNVYPMIPYGDMTLEEALRKETVFALSKYGLEPTTKISGILVGV